VERETPLAHGSDVGTRVVAASDGEVDDDGSTVALRLPRA
jgi:hypothetical protein